MVVEEEVMLNVAEEELKAVEEEKALIQRAYRNFLLVDYLN